jgi:2-amino-4-hydroxy-6-hydroxymethyldihydropteridine diphosphokinase
MKQPENHLYLIALGSNQRHPLIGGPVQILAEALAALEMADIDVFSNSQITISRPIGPSKRTFANSATILTTQLDPPELLNRLKQIEVHFGRRTSGQRWRERVLDLDIILWSGGIWISETPPLAIPHPDWKNRHFVITPAAQIAANWQDPITGKTIKHLQFCQNRAKRVDPQENDL